MIGLSLTSLALGLGPIDGPSPLTFAVLAADGTSYTTTRIVLDASDVSYTVPQAVLAADGTSYNVS